jgi:peptidoglycan-associated lipoprotein
MNSCAKTLIPLIILAFSTVTGCAKEQVLRKDEAPTPAPVQAKVYPPSPAPAPSATPAASTPASKVDDNPVVEQNLSSEQKAAAGSGELQSRLESIYFDFDAQGLTEASRATLSKNAALLTGNPQAKVRVEGHCDERGSDEYNLALGQKRADAAVKYLRSLGIAPERLSSLSFGKEKPADPGHDEAAWAKNRRDEFNIVK